MAYMCKMIKELNYHKAEKNTSASRTEPGLILNEADH